MRNRTDRWTGAGTCSLWKNGSWDCSTNKPLECMRGAFYGSHHGPKKPLGSPSEREQSQLESDSLRLNHGPPAFLHLGMILSEDRYPLFRIMPRANPRRARSDSDWV